MAMNNESPEALTSPTKEGTKLKAGTGTHGDFVYNFLDSAYEPGRLDVSIWGATAVAEARGYIVKVLGDHKKQEFARFFGGHIGRSVGVDLQSFLSKGKLMGAEAIARATLVEAQVENYFVHLGAGLTTGLKLEDGTIELKIFGTGFKIGKWNGFSMFDNEFAFHIAEIFSDL